MLNFAISGVLLVSKVHSHIGISWTKTEAIFGMAMQARASGILPRPSSERKVYAGTCLRSDHLCYGTLSVQHVAVHLHLGLFDDSVNCGQARRTQWNSFNAFQTTLATLQQPSISGSTLRVIGTIYIRYIDRLLALAAILH